uniref:NADH-ubiquinone oxidoreductase chain 4 n=1 Tax=Enterogyrus malmbergi TaxID=2593014 RepID=A0A6M3R676_9PLAT|nr:NADH dehydrogenase subunit 4 [Enterogyrus malmbergi]QJD07092.1 NADH dehydrogenase subunit 4 [Enterogyrus malmbergi]
MGFWFYLLLVASFLLYSVVSPTNPVLPFSWIILDNMAVYLCLISIAFVLSFGVVWSESISLSERSFLLVSVVSSLLCFMSNNALLFWFFYELSILPLLISLFVNSPYSERFIAGWYLLGYVIVTSLPMLFILVYLSVTNGSYFISSWNITDEIGHILAFILFVLFITKVPLPPFHSWLPIVHAEASTFVSVVLSGYVMKLGIIGVFRFCSEIFMGLGSFISVVFLFSIMFLFVSYSELDTKRWLAFLSLSHILIAVVAIYYVEGFSFISIVFCLGHGLSAGLMFYLFSVFYNACGSRNWLIIGMADNISNLWRIQLVLGFLTLVSFPPSINFITEVITIGSSVSNFSVMLLLCIYVLLSGVIPVVLLSYLLCNTSNRGFSGLFTSVNFVTLVSLWCVWFFMPLL